MTYPQAPGNPGPTHLARIYAVDIAEDNGGSPLSWETLFGLSAFQPAKSPVTQDGSTFDTGVLQVTETVGFSLNLSGTVKAKPYGGLESDGQRIIREAAESYAVPQPQIWARWYKRNGDGDALQALFQAEWNPQSGGPTDLLQVDWVLHAQTLPTTETNPATLGAAVPVISSILPTGKSIGELVTIKGTGFGDAVDVDFDGGTSADFTVVNNNTIIVVIPSGVTGAVPVIVENPAGQSTSKSYTVI